jgi:glycosyltransferase involved in cell wall biosynthesis
MKIAILTASFLPKVGGAQVFAYNAARQLAATGNEVHVYVPAENYAALGPQFRDMLRPLPRKFYGIVRRIPVLGLYWAQRFLRRRQAVEGYDVWLVIVTFPSGYVATCLKGRVPIVLRASGEDIQKSVELDYGLRLDPSEEARISRTIQSFDKLAALTQSVRTDFLDLGVSDEAIEIVPNGVDLDWFLADRDKAEIRAELGWPQDRLIILTTGRNHRKKGYDLIPAIADKLRDRGLLFRWYIVGKGTDRIDDEIRSRGLTDFVITHEEVGVAQTPGREWRFPDRSLVSMYQAADIYAFPSLMETFGMVQLEAMAAGAAVVSTDAPGCRDVIKHEQNGLQAHAGDVDSFVVQLGRLLEDQALREDLSAKGKAWVQDYSWANVANQYEAVFTALINDHRSDGSSQN